MSSCSVAVGGSQFKRNIAVFLPSVMVGMPAVWEVTPKCSVVLESDHKCLQRRHSRREKYHPVGG